MRKWWKLQKVTSYIRNLPISERPRERLEKYGASNLSNEELIAIIIKTGTKEKSVKDLANEILSKIKKISDFTEISINSITKIKGIGKAKAIELLAAIELGKRVYFDKDIDTISFTNAESIYEYYKIKLFNKKQEYFYVVYLDNKKNFITDKILFIGTINMSVVHPREIYKEAYLNSASYIICIHNHPSGDPYPSKEDINLTNRISEIGKITAIPLLDHIVIGKNKYYSFFENNGL